MVLRQPPDAAGAIRLGAVSAPRMPAEFTPFWPCQWSVVICQRT